MTPRVQKVIDISLKALLEDTICSGNCEKCLVGHLVIESMGGRYSTEDSSYIVAVDKKGERISTYWNDYIRGRRYFQKNPDVIVRNQVDYNKGRYELSKLDFTFDEIDMMEDLYETTARNNCYSSERVRNILGLTMAINYLLVLDGCVETVEEVFVDKINNPFLDKTEDVEELLPI